MSDAMSDSRPMLQSQGLDPVLRFRLSLMMLLQYAVWGSWYSVLSKYLGSLEFEATQIGDAYGTVALASIFAPLIIGQIADRWVPSQFLLGILHLGGAAALYMMTKCTEFTPFYYWLLAWSCLYIPTVSLTNALAMHHVPDAGRQFPGIRVFGTIGWILIGLVVGWFLNESSVQPLYAGAMLSVVLGVYCFALPNTPPKGKGGEMFPFLRAFGLLREPAFALFIGVSFVIAVILAGYFTWTPQFLADRGFKTSADVMIWGQFMEMLLLPFLPFFLKRIGMKWTLVMGMAAWGVRYALFGGSSAHSVIYLGILLHGVCYDFFFVAAYIHVDNKAGEQIRASAQALFNLVVMGLGMYLGNKIFGQLVANFTTETVTATLPAATQAVTKVVDWTRVWSYPAAGAAVALLIMILGFREKRGSAAKAGGGGQA